MTGGSRRSEDHITEVVVGAGTWRDMGLEVGSAHALTAAADLAAVEGQAERAVWLLGAAAALHEASGAPEHASVVADASQAAILLGASMGAERFAALWAIGRALPVGRIIDEVRCEPHPRSLPGGS